jgi:heptosyltransferase-2/heptosyltransferase-3
MGPERALQRGATDSAHEHRGTERVPAAITAAPAPPLVVRFAAFGDVVLLTPLLEVLHRRYRQPVDLLASGGWTPQLLAYDPRVGHVQLVRSRRAPYALCRSQRQAVAWLRARPPGPVYLCEPDDKSQWLLDRAGIERRRVVRAFDFQAGEQIHFTDWWVSIAQRTPELWQGDPLLPALPATDSVPQLHLHPAEPAECAAWLRARRLDRSPLVLLQPGNKRTFRRGRLAGSSDNKHWPAQRWAELARAILAELPGAQVLLCGAPSERGVTGDIRRRIGIDGRVHDLTCELPVRRLLALQARAHSMISVDTGPAHAAAALGCPLVVLFGREDQRVWRPRARHDTVRAVGGERGPDSTVADIPVQSVMGAWRQLAGPQ